MYQETFRPPFALLVYAIAAIVAVSIGVLLFANLSEAGEVELEGVASAAAVLPVLLAVAWMSSRYHVRVDGAQLHFGYRGWSASIPLTDIELAEEVNISWLSFGGMGWRLRGLKHIGYITGSGPGVRLRVRSSGRTYTLNCSEPARLLQALGHQPGSLKPPH